MKDCRWNSPAPAHPRRGVAGWRGKSYVVLVGILFTVAAVGCKPKVRESGTELPVVPVSNPEKGNVTEYVDFTGRAQAVHPVDIIARVTGYLRPPFFKEGSEVKKGNCCSRSIRGRTKRSSNRPRAR